MDISSATLFYLTASVPPQKERYVHHSFHGSIIMFVNLKKGKYQVEKSMPGTHVVASYCLTQLKLSIRSILIELEE